MYSFGKTKEDQDAIILFTRLLRIRVLATSSNPNRDIRGMNIDEAIIELSRNPLISIAIRQTIIEGEIIVKSTDKSSLNNNLPLGYGSASPIWNYLMRNSIFSPFYISLFNYNDEYDTYSFNRFEEVTKMIQEHGAYETEINNELTK
jgi:hypothetical protein